MPKDDTAGTVTILSMARIRPGSTTGWYDGNPVGLARIKDNAFVLKFEGSVGVGSNHYATLYGGISGSPATDFALKGADLIGSLYLGTTTGTRRRVKVFATSGAMVMRARITNAAGGTPIINARIVIGRTLYQ